MDMAMPMMVRAAPVQKVMDVLLGFVRSFIFGISGLRSVIFLFVFWVI